GGVPVEPRPCAVMAAGGEAARRPRPPFEVRPVAGPGGGGDVRERRLRGGAPVSAGPTPGSFTLPPGTFRIDRDGVWRHEGHEVTHPGVLRNLYANLRVDAAGHFLQVGPARIAVEVDDAPFVATRVHVPAPPPAPPTPLP